MRHEPGPHGKGLVFLDVADCGQLDPGRPAHPERGPKPSVLAPHRRIAGCGHARDRGPGRRIGQLRALLLIEPEPDNEPGSRHGLRRTSAPLEPGGDEGARLAAARIDLALHAGPAGQSRVELRAIFTLGHVDVRRPVDLALVAGKFGEVVEESRKLIEVLLADLVEFVVVTNGAAGRQTPGRPRRRLPCARADY